MTRSTIQWDKTQQRWLIQWPDAELRIDPKAFDAMPPILSLTQAVDTVLESFRTKVET